MGEYINEETYPILNITDLYLPKRPINSYRSLTLNHIKQNLQDFERSFNEIRCENLDFVATYRPFHFNGEDFGLYLYAEGFCMLLLSILQKSYLDFRQAHTLALDATLTHGSFHYLFERYALLAENYIKSPETLYTRYKREIYSKHWGTAKCYEETLANTFVFLCPALPHDKQLNVWRKIYLKFLMLRQRDGYCQAVNVNSMNIHQIFTKLEKQLNIDRALLPNEAQDLPTLYKFVEAYIPFRYLGLPIFLVNDCKLNSDFERIVEVLFPEI